MDKSSERLDDERRETPQVHGLRRPIYLLLAFFFLVLGVLGVLLPGIPATPFLLLMSYFLVRVSPKLHARVMRWPVVGPPLKDCMSSGAFRRSSTEPALAVLRVAPIFESRPLLVCWGRARWWPVFDTRCIRYGP